MRKKKLYVDFGLCGGLVPLMPALFKCELYRNWIEMGQGLKQGDQSVPGLAIQLGNNGGLE